MISLNSSYIVLSASLSSHLLKDLSNHRIASLGIPPDSRNKSSQKLSLISLSPIIFLFLRKLLPTFSFMIRRSISCLRISKLLFLVLPLFSIPFNTIISSNNVLTSDFSLLNSSCKPSRTDNNAKQFFAEERNLILLKITSRPSSFSNLSISSIMITTLLKVFSVIFSIVSVIFAESAGSV